MRRALPILLTLAACGFPDVTYSASTAPDASSTYDGSADGASSGGNEAGDGLAEASGAPDAPADTNDAAAEVGSADSAVDAATCDYDQDQYPAEGAVCGGLDCDDHDPRANPGVKNFQTYAPTPTTNGDWNCDGVVEKEFPTNVSCNMLTLGPGCAAYTGLVGDPPCGSSGAFVQCAVGTLGLTCTDGPMTMQVQGCK